MASIKVKFRPSTVADHEGTIYYQIIHERKVRQLLTEYKVFPAEWDENRSMVTTTQKSERKSFILSIRERIRWDIERLTKFDRKLDSNGLIYTADDVIDEFNRYARCNAVKRAMLLATIREIKVLDLPKTTTLPTAQIIHERSNCSRMGIMFIDISIPLSVKELL